MKKQIILLTGLVAYLGCLPDVDADGHTKDLTYAKLPDNNVLLPLYDFDKYAVCQMQTLTDTYAKLWDNNILLPLYDFDKYVVDQQMGEMYFALMKPAAFVPDVNYKSTIQSVSGTPNYRQVTIGETPGENPRCARGTVSLAPVNSEKSLFYRGNDVTSVQAMWSSEPSKYIWSMRCSNYYPGKKKCLFKDIILGVYVNGNLDDIRVGLIEDLCKATGLKFGYEKFKWFFTFGENTLC